MRVSTSRSGTPSVVAVALISIAFVLPSVATGQSAAAVQSARQVGTTYYPISGGGSTWSQNALDQWNRNVKANYGWKIDFDPSGSSAGRQQFGQGTLDFAVSEIPYDLSGSDSPDPHPQRSLAYVPIVAGGTAFMYNLVIGGQRVTNLRLSGENLAKIFTGVITKWNDPAIAADNPKLALPAITIVPIVRSDGSGTTAQLTAWMRAQHPALWSAYCAKANKSNCGITSNFPIVPSSAFIGQQGSNGVAGLVTQSKSVGAITYVEASYALNARFPVAKMLNAAGYYTEPTAQNVAVSLLAAVINSDVQSPDYLTANLSGVYGNQDPRTYPLSSYSYMIMPTALEGNFTENKGLTLADFASYFLCEGQQQAEVLGYSPLPVNLASAGLAQIQKIPGGNPKNKDVSTCNNPTFSSDGSNKLAATAPQPQDCDKQGSDQCLTGTGGAADTPTAGSSGTGSGTGSSGSKGGTGAGGTSVSTPGPGSADGGAAVGLTGGGNPVVAGSSVDLPGRDLSFTTIMFMALAVTVVVVAVLLPPVIARRRALAGAGSARGPTPKPRSAQPRRPKPTPALEEFDPHKSSAPRVNLLSRFTKRGRAVPPMGGS